KQFNDKMFGSLTFGNNMNQIMNQGTYGRGRNMAIPNFYNLSNTSDRYADESSSRRRSAAFYYDANFSYNNMYFIGTSGRYEYSSTFGPNQRAFFFPSVNGSVVLSEIPALKEMKHISLVKVRAAVAQSANTPAPYSAYSYYNQPFFTDGFTNGLSFPYNGYNGYGKSNLIGNTGLKPELTTGTEFGADIRFFDNRLTLDVTYYNQVSTNVLLQRPIAYSTGHSAIWDNGGEIVNKGWEILVGGSPVKSENFEWNISVNYTKNKNEVKKLIGDLTEFELETGFGNPAAYATIGQPYGALYGTTWERNEKGQLIVEDGLPIQSVTLSNLGSAYPEWTAGIRNTFTYKNFSLSALLDIRQGGKIWNGTLARLQRYGASAESEDRERTYVIEGVKPDGTPNDVAISAFDYFANYKGDGAATEMNIEEGSWVRLRELSFVYLIKKVPFLKEGQTIEITATGRNLWLMTDYKGVDPETSLTGAGSNIGGFDYFNMPNTKSYNMGVKFNF
ncbi:MAG TPA: TonB-dependent receptor, partial [Catalimonadaceae bacterium]|nr:TonB-dependent receptor [Catalimonadaceae bacterium]